MGTRILDIPLLYLQQNLAYPYPGMNGGFAVMAPPDMMQSHSAVCSSRTSSAYHCVTSLVGAGVLGLPAATASLGWAAASILTFFFWITSLYTLW